MKSILTFVGGLLVSTAFVFAIAVQSVSAQGSQIDPTFNAVPAKELASTTFPKSIALPDGRVIGWGGSFVVEGSAKGSILRLNSDGTLDNSFSYCSCLVNNLGTVVVQPDGKLLVAGDSFTTSQAKVVRLNSDGSQDQSFLYEMPTPINPSETSTANVWAAQPDGKAFIETRRFFSGLTEVFLRRVNNDGSADSGFAPFALGSGRTIVPIVREVLLNPDGSFYVALYFTGINPGISLRRGNADGSTDSTWESPTFGSPSSPPNIADLDRLADGSVIVAGRFDTINGTSKPNLARLLPAGNVDLSFNAPTTSYVADAEVLSSGKILINSSAAIGQVSLLSRLNANGSLDPTFEPPTFVSNVYGQVSLDSLGRIVFYGVSAPGERRFFRVAPDGPVDNLFNPQVFEFGRVSALARQSDGSFILAGDFTLMGTTPRRSLARVLPNGSVDPTFNVGNGFNGLPPRELLVQADGKILAIGEFTDYDGNARFRIARINTDGTVDNAFAPDIVSGAIFDIALQQDQKIVIVGVFSQVNGTARTSVARLNVDGGLDNTFNPVVGGSNLRLEGVLAQADGKIVIGGTFNGVNGFNRTNLARLSQDGSLDQSFNAGSFPTAGKLFRQADGKYLTAGAGITRRNIDGTVDSTFSPPSFDGVITAINPRPDGSLLIGGTFSRVGSAARRYFVRLLPNGGLYNSFFQTGADGAVMDIAEQPDGKVVLGGDFRRFENAPRAGNVRLSVAPLRASAPFDFDGDGRADIGFVRPSTYDWFILRSMGGVMTQNFGLPEDVLAPADYDGDGKTDLGVFRPSTGTFWKTSSVSGGYSPTQWGIAGDIPRPSDYDGDGKADFIVYRPSNGVWYRLKSDGSQISIVGFGQSGDQPLTGDFDGDGKSDPAVFRPSNGTWWYLASSNGGGLGAPWGTTGDIPVPADFDGDGRTEFAVYRPSNGTWYIYNLATAGVTITQFGLNGDRPVAADYDGDGKADIAVFRPSSGVWYVQQSTGGFFAAQFGTGTDLAIPNSFVP